MLKIGDFSKLSLVSVKTLRYYDELGLLRPVRVDEMSGYRYYTAEQLPRLNRILALKDLGLSLEQVAQLLRDDLTGDQIRGILRLKAAEARQRMEDEQARVIRVEARLRQIELEGKLPMYEVVLKKVPTQRVASLRRTIPTYGHLGMMFGEIFGYLGPRGIAPQGPPVAIYHDQDFKEQDPDIEIAVPVDAPLSAAGPVQFRDMSGGDLASVIYRGSYEGIPAGYNALMAWLEPNGYRVAGPLREAYLHGPAETKDPDEYVTEIQLPVVRA